MSTASWYRGLAGEEYSYDLDPESIRKIAQLVHHLADECDFELIDGYALSEVHPEWFALDSVHPNAEGATVIAKLVAAAIVQEGCAPGEVLL